MMKDIEKLHDELMSVKGRIIIMEKKIAELRELQSNQKKSQKKLIPN